MRLGTNRRKQGRCRNLTLLSRSVATTSANGRGTGSVSWWWYWFGANQRVHRHGRGRRLSSLRAFFVDLGNDSSRVATGSRIGRWGREPAHGIERRFVSKPAEGLEWLWRRRRRAALSPLPRNDEIRSTSSETERRAGDKCTDKGRRRRASQLRRLNQDE